MPGLNLLRQREKARASKIKSIRRLNKSGAGASSISWFFVTGFGQKKSESNYKSFGDAVLLG